MNIGMAAGLDPRLNTLPDRVRHVHLLGIGGTGVGALAGMFQASGCRVTGSDRQVYPPMSDFLAERGISFNEGYRAENLIPRPDLVVVGNVIRAVNPEAVALAAAKIPYLSMPQALAHCFIREQLSLVVTGTHGKTTTSSILASLLKEAGADPGFLIGGLVKAFGRNFNLGGGEYFVVEGDEYDTAFFDKGPKFLHYRPRIAVITSIEFDHADIYADLEAVKSSFAGLVRIMPIDGCLIARLDDPVVAEIVRDAPCPVVGYGLDSALEWSLSNVRITREKTVFAVSHAGRCLGDFQSVMPGVHNGLNSLAVIAVLDRLGLDPEVSRRGLAAFEGVCRRQEVRGVIGGITVIDDFAHHPTAVRETIASLRAVCQGRLIVVFEPRTNSSRRRVFQDAYAECFDQADLALIREPLPLEGVDSADHFSARQLVSDLVRRGNAAEFFADTDRILEYLLKISRSGDVVAILSNGGFDRIHLRFLEALDSRG